MFDASFVSEITGEMFNKTSYLINIIQLFRRDQKENLRK